MRECGATRTAVRNAPRPDLKVETPRAIRTARRLLTGTHKAARIGLYLSTWMEGQVVPELPAAIVSHKAGLVFL